MKLAAAFNHIKSSRKYEKSDVWVLPTCNIGLEWEFEQGGVLKRAVDTAYTTGKNQYLVSKEDGSLRDGGVEIVTTGDGLFGKDLEDAITLMDEFAKAARPVCNYRTAFHVHLDIRDMEVEEVHNLLLLYCLIEKPLFNFVGKDRENSNFCVPWYRTDAYFSLLRNLQGNKNPGSSLISGIGKIQRYSALNCQSIQRFGTLEFRHMENANEEITHKQIRFINIVMALKKSATSLFRENLHGEALFNWLKKISGNDLLRHLGLDLPTDGWDYPDTLMLATGLVQFKVPKNNFFNDAVLNQLSGVPANWK